MKLRIQKMENGRQIDEARLKCYANQMAEHRAAADENFRLAAQVTTASSLIDSVESQSYLADATGVYTTLVNRNFSDPTKIELLNLKMEEAKNKSEIAKEIFSEIFPNQNYDAANRTVNEAQEEIAMIVKASLESPPDKNHLIHGLPIAPTAIP